MSKLPSILYVEPIRCFFYGEGFGEILQLDFPAEIARDSEVVSKEKLAALIQAFIQTNNIPPSVTTIIISNLLTFEKDLSGMPIAQQTTESQSFLEAVPFENVASQTVTVGGKKMLIGTNKDFIDALRIPLTAQGFTVPFVVPFSILSILAPELQTNLDLKIVFQKVSIVRQYNFLTPAEQPHAAETFTGKPKNMTRVFLLVGVFAFLLVVLGFVIVANLPPQKKSQPQLRPKNAPLTSNFLSDNLVI